MQQPFLFQTVVGAVVLAGLLGSPPTWAQNHSLHLQGDGEYVELPQDVFRNLEQATIEAWIKWDRCARFAQPIGFGNNRSSIGINQRLTSMDLQYYIYDRDGSLHLVTAPNILHLNQWMHIAATSGPGGMKLFVNGVLAGEGPFEGSFASLNNGEQNFFGGRHWRENEFFGGEIDEVRVWSVARDQEAIRKDMFHELAGTETHLVAYWNFNQRDTRDLASSRIHGNSIGTGVFEENELPKPSEVTLPTVVSGTIRGKEGGALSNAALLFDQNGIRFETMTDGLGRFRRALFTKPGTYTVFLRLGDSVTRIASVALGEVDGELNLQLPDFSIVSGTASDFTGEPHVNVLIQAVRNGALVASGKTNSRGAYSLELSSTGQYEVQCALPETPSKRIEFVPSDQTSPSLLDSSAEFQIRSGGKIRDVNLQSAPPNRGFWRTFSSFDGIGSDNISAIAESRDGSLWIGTWGSGISHYDGRFAPNLTINDGLPHNEIVNVLEDPEGRLWIATLRAGVARIDESGIKTFSLEDGLPSLAVRALHSSSNGRVWFGTENGMSYMEDASIHSLPEWGTWGVSSILEATDGRLWFGTDDAGAFHYDGSSLIQLTTSDGLASNGVLSIVESSTGEIWIGTYNGLTRYRDGICVSYSTIDGLPSNSVMTLWADADSTIWIGTGRGLCRFDGKRFIEVKIPPSRESDWIGDVQRDSGGSLWVATQRGLFRYDDRSIATYTTRDGLPDNGVSTIHCDTNERVWAGSIGFSSIEKHGISNLETSSPVSAISESADGTIWIGDLDGSILHLGPDQKFLAETVSLSSPVIFLYGAASGKLWAGTTDGPVLLDQKTGGFVRPPLLPNVGNGYGALEDRNGRTWLGTTSGVFRFDGSTFSQPAANDWLASPPELYSSSGAGDIEEDPEGGIWACTEFGAMRLKDGRWTHLTRSDGLADTSVNTVHRTKDGVLWFGTQNGVSAFDGICWSSIDTRDGLIGNLVRDISSDSNDRLWFACTYNGVTAFQRNPVMPKVKITSVTYKEDYIDLENLPVIDADTRVSFAYRAQDKKTLQEKHQFRCRIIQESELESHTETEEGSIHRWRGMDSAWNHPTRLQSFEWITAQPGTYIFQVQAIDRDLNYSKPASLILTVVPLWYQNALILIPSGFGLALLVIGTGTATWRYLVQRAEARRLREQLFKEERTARNTLETANKELTSAKEAAEAANRAKSTFLAHMSHEIRTPLNAVLGFTRILQRKTSITDDVRRPLETIERNGKHLLGLINDVLDLSRIEAGHLELDQNRFDLRALIHALSSTFEGICTEKGLNWIEDIFLGENRPSGPIWVEGDEQKLRQVIINLLSNAVKFTSKGSITVSVCSDVIGEEPRSAIVNRDHEPASSPFKAENLVADERSATPSRKGKRIGFGHGRIRFEVRDTGPGIAPADQHRILDPFEQVRSKDQTSGTGLGLAIARRYVSLMGGELEFESAADRGSRFFFTVPLDLDNRDQPACPPPRNKIESLAPGEAVEALIVDDISENLAVLDDILSGIGATTHLAAGGQEAISALQERKPDIVFLDIWMPGMDGRETAQRIRSQPINSDVVLIAVSASVLPDERSAFLKAGFDGFIAKPVQESDVFDMLAKFLRVQFRRAAQSEGAEVTPEVLLPRELHKKLEQALRLNNLTRLEEAIREIGALGPEATKPSQALAKLARELDLDGIRKWLEQVQHD